MFVDTHCHLDSREFDLDRGQVIKNSKEQGIFCLVNIGADIASSRLSVELAKTYDFIYAAVGIHPHDADNFNQEAYDSIKNLAAAKKVVAIGEIGLDFYKNYSKEHNQKKVFTQLLGLAKELALPVVMHTRNADDATLEIIKDFLPHPVVVHCFSGDEQFLKKCLDFGFFISFTCNITYKKAQNLRDIAKAVPLDRLFLETDAPYLSPEGKRGTRNDPTAVKVLAAELAKIKGVDIKQIASATTNNAKGFFKIK